MIAGLLFWRYLSVHSRNSRSYRAHALREYAGVYRARKVRKRRPTGAERCITTLLRDYREYVERGHTPWSFEDYYHSHKATIASRRKPLKKINTYQLRRMIMEQL